MKNKENVKNTTTANGIVVNNTVENSTLEGNIIKILEPYKTVNFTKVDEDGVVIIKVKRYYYGTNYSTLAQTICIRSLKNMSFSVGYNNVIRHLSKFAARALITLSKSYPNINFYIII